jgi:hypothetical protein
MNLEILNGMKRILMKMSGLDLDIPGSELDDDMEQTGSEDEE